MYKKILDQFAGILLAAILLIIVGTFVAAAQPRRANPNSSGAAKPPSPTPGSVSTITGVIVIDCQTSPCTSDFSAFDVAAYPKDQAAPTAQGPIDKSGHFTLRLPANTYTIKTIPESIGSVSVTAIPDHPTNVTLHIKLTSKAP